MPTLAWRPFLDPLPLHSTWFLLLIPLSFFVAVIYKAARLRRLDGYWTSVFVMTAQIVLGMIALALATYLFIMVYVRFIAERMAGG